MAYSAPPGDAVPLLFVPPPDIPPPPPIVPPPVIPPPPPFEPGMVGMNNQTGRPLGGLLHLKQSILDILLTPLGTRVMRRDYGSRLFELIDAPMNSATIIAIVAATAEALAQWEPRIAVERVTLDEGNASGRIGLTLYGKYLPDGKQIKLDGIIL